MPKVNFDIEKEIEEIESNIPSVSGITISRCFLDVALFKKYGIKVKVGDSKESALVWCLGVGVMNMPKTYYYGRTIRKAIEECKKNNKQLKAKCVCRLCQKFTDKNTAHRWQGKYIGECCWDERLRTTE